MSTIIASDTRRFRVAFDMDGVLADLESAIARHSEELFGGRDPAAGPIPPRRRRRLWNRVRSVENFWETLDEIDAGSVARLAAVAAERRWETIFLTTRPETAGDPAQTQTHRWLVARGFSCPNVFVVRRSRGQIAAALELDAIVDDRAQSCVDVVSESSAQAMLAWRRQDDPPAIALNRLRIDVVKDVDESLDLLMKMDSDRQRPRSHLARLLQSFAYRSPASVA